MLNNDMTAKVKNAMFCMTRQCWEQGMLSQALLETGDYKNLMMAVYDMVLRQSEDGRLCNIENTPALTDSSFCIPSTLAAGRMKKNKQYIEAAERNIDFLLHRAPRCSDTTLFHMKDTQEIWADSAAFLPYSLALDGYYEEAILQMNHLVNKLYVPDKGLYYHIWDEGKKLYKRPFAWGVGNGWILTGLMRLYLVLPDKYKTEKDKFLNKFRNLLSTLLSFKPCDHIFHDIIDDSDSFQETECSEMVAYAIFRAVKEKMIDPSYMEAAEKIREAIQNRVSEQGLVTLCSSSPEFIYPGTSVEGQAHYLLMEKAYNDLIFKSSYGKL